MIHCQYIIISSSQLVFRWCFDWTPNVGNSEMVFGKAFVLRRIEAAAFSCAPEKPDPLAQFLIRRVGY